MDHTFTPARRDRDGTVLGRGAHKFVKLDLVRVTRGQRSGTIVGTQIVARCEVGDGPKQLSLEELEGLLDGKSVVREGPEGRIDVRVEVGDEPNKFSVKEVKEMIQIVKAERGIEEKKGPGRPKKDDGAADS